MATDTRDTRAKRFLAGGLLLAAFAAAAAARAEVVVQGSATPLAGPDIAITANLGVTSGNNLFHSFSVFNVLGGESAVFSGPASIQNVISRVTGGISDLTGLKSSLIDGPVSLSIAGANFYFINPNGIVFGASGSINATGSVYMSTADVVRFADGSSFFADPSAINVLSMANPVAFGFLSANPAPIVLNGPLLLEPVPAGKTFALVAGDIDIRAGSVIVAPGAIVSLASVASAGDAILLDSGAVDLRGFPSLGHVRLSEVSFVDVGFGPDGSAGSIYIRGGQLTLSGAGLLAQSFGDNDGGVIDIAVRGDLNVETESGTISVILTGSFGGAGAGPSIDLDVGGTLRLSNGSFILSESYGAGPAGDINIRAGAVEVQGLGAGGVFTGISAKNFGDGAGPSLSISTGSLQVLNGGLIETFNDGPGTGGDLSITADSVLATGTGAVTLSLSTETRGGNAGNLSLDTRTLELRDGARISSSTGGFGDAGALNITASERITVDGGRSGIFSATVAKDVDVGIAGNAGVLNVSTPLLVMNGGVIDSTTVGDGDAGAIGVRVGALQLTGGAQIRSFSGGFDQVTGVLNVGTGAAGSVSIEASGSVTISGASATATGQPSGLLAETRGSGAGGNVSVRAFDLSLSDGATISASSLGTGLAGDVQIHLGDSLILRNASIKTQATISDGGNIIITAPRLIRLVDSQITTSVASGVGGGGNIFIDPQFVVLQNSQIIANAFGGPGGNIQLIAGQLIIDPLTIISASSALGIDGTVNIDAPDTDASSGLAVLPASLLDAASLMQAGCGAARAGLSSLVQLGRGGLPADPDNYLPSLDLTGVSRGGGSGGVKTSAPALLTMGALAFASTTDCRR